MDENLGEKHTMAGPALKAKVLVMRGTMRTSYTCNPQATITALRPLLCLVIADTSTFQPAFAKS